MIFASYNTNTVLLDCASASCYLVQEQFYNKYL